MPIKSGNREQIMMFPPTIEEYVGRNDAVRAYDAFVENMNWEDINIQIASDMGRPRYDSKTMLKLLLYSYSYGTRSSRKIERSCHHNLSYIWLTKGLKPDHKTIAEFRRNNEKAIKEALKQCVRFCVKTGLVEGNILFVDGTKVRANAGIKNTHTSEKCQKAIENIDQKIAELLKECEQTDLNEKDQAEWNKLTGDLADAENLKAKVRAVMAELKQEDRKSKNAVDPECANMHSRQGSHAAYNVQHTVDDKHGLIVSANVVSDSNDSGQFAEQIESAQEMTGRKCQTACADAGYSHTDELSKIDEKGIKVVVPSQKQALHNAEEKPFDKDQFTYDAGKDQYICPEGHVLRYRGLNKQKQAKVYKISQPGHCRKCPHFGVCTHSKEGRKVTRLLNADAQQKFEKQYLENQDIYRRRKEKVEHPFGHIKRNLGVSAFLMRGRRSVQSEASILAVNFNISRMITLFGGVAGLIEALSR